MRIGPDVSLGILLIINAAALMLFVLPVVLGFIMLSYGYDLPFLAYLAGVGAIALGVSLIWTGARLIARLRQRKS
jgi:hypothetical protein